MVARVSGHLGRLTDGRCRTRAIRYKNTLHDLLEFSAFHARNSPHVRRMILSYQLAGAVVVAGATGAVAWWISDPFFAVAGPVAAVAYVCLVPSSIRWSMRRSAQRLYEEGRLDGLVGEHRLEIEEDGLSASTAVEQSKIRTSIRRNG